MAKGGEGSLLLERRYLERLVRWERKWISSIAGHRVHTWFRQYQRLFLQESYMSIPRHAHPALQYQVFVQGGQPAARIRTWMTRIADDYVYTKLFNLHTLFHKTPTY